METEETRHAAIQAVLDKQEIYDALARFCRALDRCDEALLRTIYLLIAATSLFIGSRFGDYLRDHGCCDRLAHRRR